MPDQVYAELFEDSSPERLQQLIRYLDPDGNGVVDFLSWSRRIRLQVLLISQPVLCRCPRAPSADWMAMLPGECLLRQMFHSVQCSVFPW